LRVLVPGGTAVVASWPPMEQVPMLKDLFTTIHELLPGLPFGGGTAPLGEAKDFHDEMGVAGFEGVVVEQVSASSEAPSLEEAWQFLYRGSAPFALLRKRLGDAAWQEFERNLIASMRQKYGSGAQKLTMTANLGIGRKPVSS
jgi:hypothetical protein